jgi:hypothetical protein
MISVLPHPRSKTARFCVALACMEVASIFVSVLVITYVWGTLTSTAYVLAFSNSNAWWLTVATPVLFFVGYLIFPDPKPRPLTVVAGALVWLAPVAVVAPLRFPEAWTLVSYGARTVPLVVLGLIGALILRRMYANPWQSSEGA